MILLLIVVFDGLAAIVRLAGRPANRHTGAIRRREHQGRSGHDPAEFVGFFSAGNHPGFP
jgi:hypothetical protein